MTNLKHHALMDEAIASAQIAYNDREAVREICKVCKRADRGTQVCSWCWDCAVHDILAAERNRVMEILEKTKDRIDCDKPTCNCCNMAAARNAGLDRALYLLSTNNK